jgi:hypothetical protein
MIVTNRKSREDLSTGDILKRKSDNCYYWIEDIIVENEGNYFYIKDRMTGFHVRDRVMLKFFECPNNQFNVYTKGGNK